MIRLDRGRAPLTRFVDELLVGGADKSALPPPLASDPDLSMWAAEERDTARMGWASRIVDEYRSVVVFSDLLHRLSDLEAPFAVLGAVHGLIGDELRHTWICAEVARWLGGPLDDLSIDLDGIGLPSSDAPPAERALEIVAREIVVAEEESISVLRAYRDATVEPSIRTVLDTLLKDEARHAAVGRELFVVLSDSLPAADIAPMLSRLPVVMEEDRRRLRESYIRGAANGPGRPLGVSLRLEDLLGGGNGENANVAVGTANVSAPRP